MFQVPRHEYQFSIAPRFPRYLRSGTVRLLRLREAAQVTLAVLAGLLSPVAAWAQDDPAKSNSDPRWGLGLSVGSVDKPYRGVDDETLLVPIIFYENRWVSIAGPVADLKLPSSGAVSFRLRARYELGSGYEAGDSPALEGMEERKGGVWIGGAALWKGEILDISAEWLSDVSNYSEGQRATLGLQRRFPFGNFALTPRVEGIWLDQKYVEYYYGVREQEALVTRPSYKGDSTVNTRIGVRLDYRPGASHSFFLDVATTRLGDEIENSPIVDGPTSSSAFLGYTYLF